MELRQAMRERRSIRGFKDTPVPKEVIRDILQTAARAVSANNNQPWEFSANHIISAREDLDNVTTWHGFE